MNLSQEEAFARIRLLRSPNIGPVSFRQLLRRFGDARTALDALPDLAARGGRGYRSAPVDRIEREIAGVRKASACYVFHDSPDFPALLAQTESAPPILTWRGDLALASRPCVAMVGARNASAAAVKLAREFAHALADAGQVIVSGLAHEAADVAGLLNTAPIGVDELIRQSGQAAGAVQMALLELEVSGRLLRHAGGRVSMIA